MGPLRERLSNRFAALRARVRRLPGGHVLWQGLVLLAGLVFVVGGLVLVPLPGPGWLIVFLGLGIWGTEFAWARRLLDRVRAKATVGTRYVTSLPRWVRVTGSAVTVLVVVAAVGGYLAWRNWWPFNSSGLAAGLGV